jgi:hypothetical protein
MIGVAVGSGVAVGTGVWVGLGTADGDITAVGKATGLSSGVGNAVGVRFAGLSVTVVASPQAVKRRVPTRRSNLWIRMSAIIS